MDLRERGDGEHRRGTGWLRWDASTDSYLLLVTGLVLAVPALSASYTALVKAPPDSWEALLYWVPPDVLLSWAWRRFRWPLRRRNAADFGAERLILLATRDTGGANTAVRAALETPLTVDEADGTPSRLANDGQLRVESYDGTLYYVLPADLPPSGPLGRR